MTAQKQPGQRHEKRRGDQCSHTLRKQCGTGCGGGGALHMKLKQGWPQGSDCVISRQATSIASTDCHKCGLSVVVHEGDFHIKKSYIEPYFFLESRLDPIGTVGYQRSGVASTTLHHASLHQDHANRHGVNVKIRPLQCHAVLPCPFPVLESESTRNLNVPLLAIPRIGNLRWLTVAATASQIRKEVCLTHQFPSVVGFGDDEVVRAVNIFGERGVDRLILCPCSLPTLDHCPIRLEQDTILSEPVGVLLIFVVTRVEHAGVLLHPFSGRVLTGVVVPVTKMYECWFGGEGHGQSLIVRAR